MTDVFLPKYEDALFLMKIREVVEARPPEVSPELLVRVEVARSRAEDANEPYAVLDENGWVWAQECPDLKG